MQCQGHSIQCLCTYQYTYHSNYGMQLNIEHVLDLCLDPQLDLDPLSHRVFSTLMS